MCTQEITFRGKAVKCYHELYSLCQVLPCILIYKSNKLTLNFQKVHNINTRALSSVLRANYVSRVQK